MRQITLEIPGEALLGLKVPWEEAGDTLRMAAAVKLFELRQLSSGAAAQLAGVPRVVFLTRLADYGVDTFSLTEEELMRDDLICDTSPLQYLVSELRPLLDRLQSLRFRLALYTYEVVLLLAGEGA